MKRQPPAPKFAARCDWCGERQYRATTAWTVSVWMQRHIESAHSESHDKPAEESA